MAVMKRKTKSQRWRRTGGTNSCTLNCFQDFQKITWFVPLVLILAGSSSALLRTVTEAFQKEVSAVTELLTEVLLNAFSSRCDRVKKLLGVSHDQVEGDVQTNLNKLTLEFSDSQVSIVYNITVAAGHILRSHHFAPGRKLFILVHGYGDDSRGGTVAPMRDALLSQGESNVLALDASRMTGEMYLRASTSVQFIGSRLAEVLAAMVHNGVDPSLIHMIGSSLGAQICAFTGKNFTAQTGRQVGRITGLDPVSICFTIDQPGLHLEAGDAAFVDVIHTDAVIGYRGIIGQADYFVNGGTYQPGCPDQSCNHRRSWLCFAESIVAPGAFPARRCPNWEAFKKNQCDDQISYMGYPAKPGTKGLFFLLTRGESPYGLGEEGLKWRNDEGLVRTFFSSLFGLLPWFYPTEDVD